MKSFFCVKMCSHYNSVSSKSAEETAYMDRMMISPSYWKHIVNWLFKWKIISLESMPDYLFSIGTINMGPRFTHEVFETELILALFPITRNKKLQQHNCKSNFCSQLVAGCSKANCLKWVSWTSIKVSGTPAHVLLSMSGQKSLSISHIFP